MTSNSFRPYLPTHLCCVTSSNFLAVTRDKIVNSASKDPTFQLGLITSTQRNHSLLPLLFLSFFFLLFFFFVFFVFSIGFSLSEYGAHYAVVSLSLKRKKKTKQNAHDILSSCSYCSVFLFLYSKIL